ncbi:hypothetical protein T06_7225 [Trichinella sp. T6]|nr:hypothetical protein T06_7225 [Trichinella sp. T6]
MFSIQFPKEILAYSLLTTFLFAINELQRLKLANIQAFQVQFPILVFVNFKSLQLPNY